MRTYLNRLSATAAGVVLTGVSLTGIAHANDGDDYALVDPSVLEALEPCDEISASDTMVYPVDPNITPDDLLFPDSDDPGTEKPWGDAELVPCYQIPVDPEDAGNGGGGDDGNDDGEEPGDGGGDDGNDDGEEPGNSDGGNGAGGNSGGSDGGQSGQGGGSIGQPGGGPSGDPSDGGGDEDSGDTADDGTFPPQETVTPTAATGTDDNGALMLAVLAGGLGALGLFLLIYGLRKRPRRGYQPAR